MYTGNNPTALKSKEMITDALVLLLQNNSFSKITIKQLCQSALVSRQTFYFLFETKEQVLESYFDDLFNQYIYQFQNSKKITLSFICQSAMCYLLSHENFIAILVKNNLNYIMTKKLEQYLLELGKLVDKENKLIDDYSIAFMSGALVETLSHHLKKNKEKSPEELALMIEGIISGHYFK